MYVLKIVSCHGVRLRQRRRSNRASSRIPIRTGVAGHRVRTTTPVAVGTGTVTVEDSARRSNRWRRYTTGSLLSASELECQRLSFDITSVKSSLHYTNNVCNAFVAASTVLWSTSVNVQLVRKKCVNSRAVSRKVPSLTPTFMRDSVSSAHQFS